MKDICFSLTIIFTFAAFGFAQSSTDRVEDREVKVIVSDNLPAKREITAPKPSPTPIIVGRPRTVEERPQIVVQKPEKTEIVVERTERSRSNDGVLSFGEIKAKIAEARRHLLTRPVSTASVGNTYEGVEIVRVAFLDTVRNELDFVVMTKESFLSTAADKSLTSENGKQIIVRTIRGNGVNTPITITDSRNIKHQPLLVQYPRVERGRYLETAYYMSTHPGLVTPEVVSAGRIYVRNVIDLAREQLLERRINIDPKVADIAERLAAVEHVDHLRFRTEPHPDIYNDIYTLFALNEGQTYRYAVSSAGAGGMVQMIPSTYRMVRNQFPQVPLNADFVEGMRDHVNASKAMLLYMQWTWEDLKRRPAIAEALLNGIATQEQLMSAGYNSNPARLAGYITRGGENWTSLIPRETQIYLQIFASVEKNVPMAPRAR